MQWVGNKLRVLCKFVGITNGLVFSTTYYSKRLVAVYKSIDGEQQAIAR